MNITISVFTLIVVIIIALLAGFWLGRSIRWMMQDTESRGSEQNEQGQNETAWMRDEQLRRERSNENVQENSNRQSNGYSIGSPVTGEVRTYCEGTRRGALIRSEKGKLYAPASGKIIRLYPMGNVMLLRTDKGVEVMMRVGEVKDELCSACFRTYVVQNEVIHKGKLLLEFDPEGLRKEGVDPSVAVTVEQLGEPMDITVTQKERVKSGEELLWIRTEE